MDPHLFKKFMENPNFIEAVIPPRHPHFNNCQLLLAKILRLENNQSFKLCKSNEVYLSTEIHVDIKLVFMHVDISVLSLIFLLQFKLCC